MLASTPVAEGVTAIYVRLSQQTDRSVSLEQQEADAHAYCKRNGWTYIEVYRDASRSASNAKRKRPEYERMLADVAAGTVVRIVCRDDDRLVRQPLELEGLIKILDPRRVPVHFTAGSELDLTTSRGRENARIRGSIARGEVERKSERQKQNNAHRVANGYPLGTVRPFGYRYVGKSFEIIPEEADAVRWAADFLLKGGTVSDVAREWNRRGFTVPKTKGEYSWPSAKMAMTNPYLCAHLQYQPSTILADNSLKRVPAWKAELIPSDKWEPILTYQQWRDVVTVLTSTRSKSGNRLKYLCGGIIECSLCGDRLKTGWQGLKTHQVRRYQCRNCDRVQIPADRIDEYVTNLLLEMLSEDDFKSHLEDEATIDRPALEAERKDLEEELNKLTDAYTRRAIRITQLEAGTKSIEGRIAEIEAELAESVEQAEREARLQPATREQFDAATIEQKRIFLKDLLPAVKVFPAGSNPAPAIEVYVHAYDRRNRLRPLPEGPEIYWEVTVKQFAHAERYERPVLRNGEPVTWDAEPPAGYVTWRNAAPQREAEAEAALAAMPQKPSTATDGMHP